MELRDGGGPRIGEAALHRVRALFRLRRSEGAERLRRRRAPSGISTPAGAPGDQHRGVPSPPLGPDTLARDLGWLWRVGRLWAGLDAADRRALVQAARGDASGVSTELAAGLQRARLATASADGWTFARPEVAASVRRLAV